MRLEFDIDSEVYPELHAALSALKSPRARAERLRQLAAAGLVWEKVRLHGAAATAPAAVEARPDLVTRPDVVPPAAPDTEPLPALARRAKRARAVATGKPTAAGFVDLAINAEPTPVPTRQERRGPRPTRHEVEQAIRELPVLMDVVADVSPLPPQLADDHDEPAPWAALNAYPDDTPAAARSDTGEADDDATELPDEALHVTALSHKPATRSRLMRMKERGLFKNG